MADWAARRTLSLAHTFCSDLSTCCDRQAHHAPLISSAVSQRLHLTMMWLVWCAAALCTHSHTTHAYCNAVCRRSPNQYCVALLAASGGERQLSGTTLFAADGGKMGQTANIQKQSTMLPEKYFLPPQGNGQRNRIKIYYRHAGMQSNCI